MKNLKLISAFVFAAIIQLSANTTIKVTNLVVTENEKSVSLNLTEPGNEIKSFTIIDKTGEIVFNEAVEKYKTSVKYNLEELPTGFYEIKIEGINFVEFYNTEITDKMVSVSLAESFVKPTVSKLNKSVLVNGVFVDNEDIQVNIYDAKGELVFSYSDKNVNSFNKTFNMEHLTKGNYNVVVSTDYFSELRKVVI